MQLAGHLDFFRGAAKTVEMKVEVLEEKIEEIEGLLSEAETRASEMFQGFQE